MLPKHIKPETIATFGKISLGLLITAILWMLATQYIGLINVFASPDWKTDYIYLYFSGNQTLKHQDIYFSTHLPSFIPAGTRLVNLNSPLVGILMAPLSLLNYTVSFWIWSILGLLLSFLSQFFIIKQTFQPKNLIFYLLGFLFLLAYFPVYANVKSGQLGAIILFLTTLGWLNFRKKNSVWAGFFWGIAFSLKLFMGVFLWMLLLEKEWTALKTFVLTSLVTSILCLVIFHPDIYWHYLQIFKQINWYSSNWNASVLGFCARLFGYHHEQNQSIFNLPYVTTIIYLLAGAFCFSLFAFFKQTTAANELIKRDLLVSYTIVVMLLISPLGWLYYFPALLIPLTVIFNWNQQAFKKQSIHLLLASVVLLSSSPSLLLAPDKITHLSVILFSGLYFYSLCILLIIIFKLNSISDQQHDISYQPIGSWALASLYLTALSPSFLGIVWITHLALCSK